MNVLLSTTYFGPVQWYQKLHRAEKVWIDGQERFVKQTYRNRCVIATANGTQTLSIPTIHPTDAGGQHAISMKEIRISDHGNWRHQHWNALASAYGESPFFDYYADDLRPFFEKRWTFLLDFNTEITMKMCELLDIEPDVALTENCIPKPADTPTPFCDFRDAISPKHPAEDTDFQPRPYYQVYGMRHGFTPNLSILDLLFNMGNESIFYL